MIQVNELRVGNWIETPRGIHQIKEVGVKNDEYYASFNNLHEGYYLSSCELIPLTEDLLRQCPIFHESHNEFGTTFHVLDENGFSVKHTIEHWTKTKPDSQYKDRFHWCRIGEVKYLHEVQNWYYMFEKKELEIKM